MKIFDLRHEDITSILSAQVCIIGSGPAGGVLAGYLGQNDIDVIVLEAGNDLPNYGSETISSAKASSSVTDLRFGWSRQFGGSSNLWAGRTHPLEEIDFKTRSWVPNSGWPITWRSVVPYYKQASKLLGIPDYEYFEVKLNSNRLESAFDFALAANSGLEDRCFQWAKKPFVVSDYLRSICANHSSLRIMLNAPVSFLQERKDGNCVEAALVTLPNGNTIKIKAEYFVLAAGGIETPRILLNSNRLKPTGIGNEYDVVGRYFSTHPKADMAALILNKSVKISHAMFIDKSIKNGSIRLGLGLTEEVQKSHALLNHYVQLSPLLEYQANKAFENLTKTKMLNNRLIDNSGLIQGVLPGLGRMTYEAMRRVTAIQPRTNKFILRGFLDQYPNKENRVSLAGEKNVDGTFKANINWRYTSEDKNSVVKFFECLDAVLRKSEIGVVEFSKLQRLQDWPLIGIHSHFMGTTRMGEDRKTSVVNKNSRIHGTKNLYVAGPSVFPTYGFANPFLTIAALSLRLGNHLLEKIQ